MQYINSEGLLIDTIKNESRICGITNSLSGDAVALLGRSNTVGASSLTFQGNNNTVSSNSILFGGEYNNLSESFLLKGSNNSLSDNSILFQGTNNTLSASLVINGENNYLTQNSVSVNTKNSNLSSNSVSFFDVNNISQNKSLSFYTENSQLSSGLSISGKNNIIRNSINVEGSNNTLNSDSLNVLGDNNVASVSSVSILGQNNTVNSKGVAVLTTLSQVRNNGVAVNTYNTTVDGKSLAILEDEGIVQTNSFSYGGNNNILRLSSVSLNTSNSRLTDNSFAAFTTNSVVSSGSISIGKSDNVNLRGNSLGVYNTNTTASSNSISINNINSTLLGNSLGIISNNARVSSYSVEMLGVNNIVGVSSVDILGSNNLIQNKGFSVNDTNTNANNSVTINNNNSTFIGNSIGLNGSNNTISDNSILINGRSNTVSVSSVSLGNINSNISNSSVVLAGSAINASNSSVGLAGLGNTTSNSSVGLVGLGNTASNSSVVLAGSGINASNSSVVLAGSGINASNSSVGLVGLRNTISNSSVGLAGSGINVSNASVGLVGLNNTASNSSVVLAGSAVNTSNSSIGLVGLNNTASNSSVVLAGSGINVSNSSVGLVGLGNTVSNSSVVLAGSAVNASNSSVGLVGLGNTVSNSSVVLAGSAVNASNSSVVLAGSAVNASNSSVVLNSTNSTATLSSLIISGQNNTVNNNSMGLGSNNTRLLQNRSLAVGGDDINFNASNSLAVGGQNIVGSGQLFNPNVPGNNITSVGGINNTLGNNSVSVGGRGNIIENSSVFIGGSGNSVGPFNNITMINVTDVQAAENNTAYLPRSFFTGNVTVKGNVSASGNITSIDTLITTEWVGRLVNYLQTSAVLYLDQRNTLGNYNVAEFNYLGSPKLFVTRQGVGVNTSSVPAPYVLTFNGSASGTSLALNDTLTFGSNSDTNLYRGTADTLKTDDNLIVAGSVGVGVTTAGTTLDVGGNGRFTSNAQTLRLVGTDHSYIGWYPKGVGSGRQAYTGFPGVGANYFSIANEITDGTGHISLLPGTDANVGIGTNSPIEKLSVEGPIYITPSTSKFNPSNIVDTSNLTETYLTLGPGTAGNDWAYLRQIGTSNNYHLSLDMHDDGDAQPGGQSFSIRCIGSAAGNPDPTPLTRFHIDSVGRVGIGTASPVTHSRLDISGGGLNIGGPGNLDAAIHIKSSFGGMDRLIQMSPTGASKPALNLIASTDVNSNNNWWSWGVDSNVWKIQPNTVFSGSAGLFINSSGKVGIGTTPLITDNVLSVAGGIVINSAASNQVGYNWYKDGNQKWAAYVDTNSNDLKFFDGTSDRVYFQAGGNVGIGIPSPTAKLDVAGTVAVDYLRVDAQDGVNEGGEIQLKGAGSYGDLNIDNFTGNLRLHTLGASNYFEIIGGSSSSPALRIHTGGAAINGNVGIGIPLPTQKLHVIGDSDANGTALFAAAAANASIRIDAATTAHYAYQTFSQAGVGRFELGIDNLSNFYINRNVQNGSAGTSIYINKSDGNVGIGTTIPTQQLTLNGAINTNRLIQFSESDTARVYVGLGTDNVMRVQTTNTASVRLATNNVDRLFVDGSGNVGIGASSPRQLLDVQGNIAFGGGPGISSGSGTIKGNQVSPVSIRQEFGTDDTGWQYRIAKNNNGVITDLVTVIDNGRVGIGITNPDHTLQVNGTIWGRHVGLAHGYAGTSFGNAFQIREANLNNNADTSDAYRPRLGFHWSNVVASSISLRTDGGFSFDDNPGTGRTNVHAGWFYSSGTTGWYNETYGGGWHMDDTSWIRTTNEKNVWVGSGLLGAQGGLTVGWGGVASTTGGAIIKGSVGIGGDAVFTPSSTLEVRGGIVSRTDSNEGGRIQIQNFNKTGTLVNDWSIWNMTGAYQNGLAFWRYQANGGNPGPAMFLTDAGNVGIGTVAPDRSLQVNGGIRSTSQLILNDGQFWSGLSIQNNNTTDSAVSFIDAPNRDGAADSHIFFKHQSDGGSRIEFGTQTPGTFADRRQNRVTIDTWGYLLASFKGDLVGNVGTSYSAACQVREPNYFANTNFGDAYRPRLGFNWGSVVASSISLRTDGAFSFDDNPGTGLTSIYAANVYANLIGSATSLANDRTNWSTYGNISNVVGQLAWKNYGNGHTIFDASNGTSPGGSAISSANPDVAWTSNYPTLMGWNGANTFGVRVDSARVADTVSKALVCRAAARVPSIINGNNTTTDVPYITVGDIIESTSFSALNSQSGIKSYSVTLNNHSFKVGHIFYGRWTKGTGFGDGIYMVVSVADANTFTCYEIESSFSGSSTTFPESFKVMKVPLYDNSLNVASVCTSTFAKNISELGYEGHQLIGQFYINFIDPIPPGYTVSLVPDNAAFIGIVEPVHLIVPPDGESISNIDAIKITSGSTSNNLVLNTTKARMMISDVSDYYNATYKIGGTTYTLLKGETAYIPKNSTRPQKFNTFSSPMACKVRFYDRASAAPTLGFPDFTPDYPRGFNISIFG